MNETKNVFRIAQETAAEEGLEGAREHDLPHMTKSQAYYNGYLDGFYNGVKWVKDYLKGLLV